MEQDKRELQLRKKLEERRIEPSVKAWDRLEQKLDEAAAPRTMHNLNLYWIAASVLIMCSVGIWMFSGEGELQDVPKVQITETTNDTKAVKTETVPAGTDKTLAETGISEQSINEPEKQSASSYPPEQKVMAFPRPAPEEKEEVLAKAEQEDDLERKKVDEVVARIMEIHEKRAVTDEEIELLLMEVQREIKTQRALIAQTGTVDAMALLNEIETELDKSFRDKVFEALKEGFVKVKTAVANRND